LNRKVPIVTALFAVFLAFSASQAFFALAATEDSWAAKAPVPSSVLGVVAANGKIYAFASNKTSEYNPSTDTWTMKKPQPSSIYGSALAVYHNKIYAIGEGNGRTQVYDPATDTWENKTPMPTPRTQLEANVVNGKIYLIGGKTGGQYSTVSLNEVYDPETNSWTTKAPIPYPVVQYASAVVDNKIYIIGGQDEFTYPMNLAVVQIYDPATDTWSFGTPMPKIVWRAAAGATSGIWAPKRIYVIGGLPEKSLFGTDLNQVYDPANDSWTFGTPMPIARFNLKVAVINDTLYVMGGAPYFNLSGIWCPENEQYTPIGYGTVPPAVAVVSPESKKYDASSVSLVFTVNKPAVWMGYSLDGQETITVTGNATIGGLTSGLHNVTVYAKDELENVGASETITFNVEAPFPTTLVVAATAIAITGGSVFAIYYFKKPKRKGNNSQHNQTKP
jgi:N-acetylneuraminic acid mutarotase